MRHCGARPGRRNMRLSRNELCPIHKKRSGCCGREPENQPKRRYEFNFGVKRIPDPSVPRGYREICTKAELNRRLKAKVEEQDGICAICGEYFVDYRTITLDHIEPRGLGGGRRDDHESNLQAVHGACNALK